MNLEPFVYFLVHTLSYFGVFLWHVIVSASIIFPLPGEVATAAAIYFGLNPILISISAASGSMVGELTGFQAGKIGGEKAEKLLKKRKRWADFVKKHFNRYGSYIIFFSALSLFPFDIVSMVAGAAGYNLKKWLVIGLIAKILKTLVVVQILTWIMSFFGWV